MAFVAVEPDGQEELGRVFHGRRGVAKDLEIGRRRVFPVRATRRQDGPDELVVRRVRGDLIVDPVAKSRRSLDAQEFAVDLKKVGPLVGPVIDELGAADQAIDQFVALDPAVALVGQELPHIIGRRRQPDEVQIDAADEIRVIREPGRKDLHPLPLGGHQFVDLREAGGSVQTKPERSPITVMVVEA